MSLADFRENLSNFDINDLDFNNVGSWPAAVKVIINLGLFALLLFLGYQLHLTDLLGNLERVERKEVDLLKQHESKAFEAANLDQYKQQMVEMRKTFGALVRQLPSDTEVPGLLEDITHTGLGSGLEFAAIQLNPEKEHEFYIELPITITATGGYHDFGSFVSGVASLPRIVTLHDFQIAPNKESASSDAGGLTLSITARTYRYNDRKDEG